MKRLFLLLGLLLVMLILTACPLYDPYGPYEPPPEPEPYDLKGTWLGTVKDSAGGEGSLSVTVTFQSTTGSGRFGGEWQGTFGETMVDGVFSGESYNAYEELDSDVTLKLIPSAATGCVLESVGVREGDKLSATYNAAPAQPEACQGLTFGVGTFNIAKQTAKE